MSKRKITWYAIGLTFGGFLIFAAAYMAPFAMRVEHFPPSSDSGYQADFYLYVSPGAVRRANAGEPITFLVQPNNTGATSDDLDFHRKDAWWMCFGRHRIADRLEVALLVPAFVRPADDWRLYTHALDRDSLTTERTDVSRIDLQLLAMIESATSSLQEDGFEVDSRFLIQGYSASGMFANRFTALHPLRVKAVAAGSPGGWPIATVAQYNGELLNYPAGVADLNELVGNDADLAALQNVPQLIVMGSEDENDAVDFDDGWDKEASAQIERLFGETPIARWELSKKIYEEAGMNAKFVLVAGIGHNRRKLQIHTTEFFEKILGRKHSDRSMLDDRITNW